MSKENRSLGSLIEWGLIGFQDEMDNVGGE